MGYSRKKAGTIPASQNLDLGEGENRKYEHVNNVVKYDQGQRCICLSATEFPPDLPAPNSVLEYSRHLKNTNHRNKGRKCKSEKPVFLGQRDMG